MLGRLGKIGVVSAACAAALAQQFDLVGQGENYNSIDGELVNLYSNTGAVNGNDTAAYSATVMANFTALDPSAQNCSVYLPGSAQAPLVVSPAQPFGPYPITNITSEAQLNGTLANITSVCYGNASLATQLSALNGQTPSATVITASQNNAPAFSLLGSGENVTTSDALVINPFANVVAANGDDSQGYDASVFALYSPADESAQNCSIGLAGSQTAPLVLNSNLNNGTLPITGIATEDALNQVFTNNLTSTCYGNATLSMTLSARNGATPALGNPQATQVNQEGAIPPGGCVNGAVNGLPVQASLPPGGTVPVSGATFVQTFGDPSTSAVPVCDFSQVMECPQDWIGPNTACYGPAGPVSNVAGVINNVTIINQNLGRTGQGSVDCVLMEPGSGCTPFANFTMAQITGVRDAADLSAA